MNDTRRHLPGHAIAVALVLFAAPVLSRQQPRFEITPDTVLVDERFSVAVAGLTPGQDVTIRVEGNRVWQSSTTLRSDAQGRVEVADPMRLVWSATGDRPAAPAQGANQPIQPIQRWVFTAEADGKVIATQTLVRRAMAEKVRAVPVRERGLVGTAYYPAEPGPRPAIIVLPGSQGGVPGPGAHAGGLASRGYFVLALAYFNAEGLPPLLQNIPLEYFATAVEWLKAQPGVDPARVGVLGTSRGGELALLLGATYPSAFRVVVANVPSSVVWPGLSDDSPVPAWTLAGKPVPGMQGRFGPADLALSGRDRFLKRMRDAGAVHRAEIPVERIGGPLLMFSGKDDQLWPSDIFAERVVERLKAHGFTHPVEHYSYENAGHQITRPYVPTSDVRAVRIHPVTKRPNVFGGTPEGQARANEDSWQKLLSFLDRHLLPASAGAAAQAAPPALAITHVTVVDVVAGRNDPDMTVIAERGRITAIGPSTRTRAPAGAQVVEAAGKFLIPGLWDMHIHSFTDNGWDWVFPLLLANGVTGVREMGTRVEPGRVNGIRREIDEGKLAGPRYGAVTGRILDGPGSQIPPSVVVETPDEARRLVGEAKAQGMDFIKVYNLLSRDVYLAILDEAKRQKIPVAGHVPLSMTASEVSDLGQVTVEHFTDIFLSCSRDEDALRDERRRALADGGARRPAGPIEMRAAASFDPVKAAAVFERFRRNGTWLVPTLVLSATVAAERPRERDDRLPYVPAVTLDYWNNGVRQSAAIVPPADVREMRDRRKLEAVGVMHRTGVNLLAGTDAPNPYVFPGFSLHDELGLLVQAGLSPLEALRTATLNPAKFLQRETDLGSVARGKLADLVVLDADPLVAIANTRKIHAVVTNGRLLDRPALDAMLAKVAAASGGK